MVQSGLMVPKKGLLIGKGAVEVDFSANGSHPGRHAQIEMTDKPRMDESALTLTNLDDIRSVCKQSRQLKSPFHSETRTSKLLGICGAMAKAAGSANVDPMGKGGIQKSTGFNPGLIVLIVVVGALLIFGVGNFLLYQYAQKNAPPKKKKLVSKKKLKKERLKGGVRPAGD